MELAACRLTRVFFLLLVALCKTFDSQVIPQIRVMCEDARVNITEGGRIQLTSQHYAQNAYVPDEGISSEDCSIYISGCDTCALTLSVIEAVMHRPCNSPIPDQGSCIHECDHLYMHEPDYPEQAHRYLFHHSNLTWTSVTRHLFIKFCRVTKISASIAFNLDIRAIDKTVTFTAASGVVTSPFWPDRYNAYVGQDVFPFTLQVPPTMTSLVTSQQQDVRLLVEFTDWNLLPESHFSIWFDDYGGRSVRQNGGNGTPAPIVWGERGATRLKLFFHTGQGRSTVIPTRPYPGFRFRWSLQPYTGNFIACGGNQLNEWGGQIDFTTAHEQCARDSAAMLNCVVVINKANNQDFEKVELFFTELRLGQSTALLVSGTLSTGSILANQSALSADHVYSDPEGLYLRVRGPCSSSNDALAVRATFVSVAPRNRQFDCDDIGFWCNENQRCIHRSLRCDGVDHCGNGNDEPDDCPTPPPPLCLEFDKYACADGYGYAYCRQQQCDGHRDCPDGEDEADCSVPADYEGSTSISIVVPCIVAALLLGAVICAAVCVRQRRKRKRELEAAAAVAQQPPPHPVTLSPFVIDPLAFSPVVAEGPPSYELTQQYDNIAYSRSLSEFSVGQPPAYEQLHSPSGTRKWSKSEAPKSPALVGSGAMLPGLSLSGYIPPELDQKYLTLLPSPSSPTSPSFSPPRWPAPPQPSTPPHQASSQPNQTHRSATALPHSGRGAAPHTDHSHSDKKRRPSDSYAGDEAGVLRAAPESGDNARNLSLEAAAGRSIETSVTSQQPDSITVTSEFSPASKPRAQKKRRSSNKQKKRARNQGEQGARGGRREGVARGAARGTGAGVGVEGGVEMTGQYSAGGQSSGSRGAVDTSGAYTSGGYNAGYNSTGDADDGYERIGGADDGYERIGGTHNAHTGAYSDLHHYGNHSGSAHARNNGNREAGQGWDNGAFVVEDLRGARESEL